MNIGSRGILLKTDRPLVMDASIYVYIKWPVLLENTIALSLIVSGTVIRVEGERAALAILEHEFRTCARSLYDGSPASAGRFRPLQPKVAGERTPPQRRPDGRARIGYERKRALSDARWERIFQEKFTDPQYYGFRLPSGSSPKVEV